MGILQLIVFILGIYQLLKLIYHISTFIWKLLRLYLLPNTLRCPLNPKSLGEWSVVTGGTSGIGRAYCEELAKGGSNIVVIARSPEKLKELGDYLQITYQVKVKTICADFCKADIYEDIEKQLEGLDIGLLINNVGMGSGGFDFFLDTSHRNQKYKDVMHCNMFSVVFMTSIVLPRMVAKSKGAIINISSVASFFAYLISVYGSTKSFVKLFSDTLALEYASKGVHIQTHMVGPVETQLLSEGLPKEVRGRELDPILESPNHFAQSSLGTLGLTTNNAGCLRHEIFVAFSNLQTYIRNNYIIKSMLEVREKTINCKNKVN